MNQAPPNSTMQEPSTRLFIIALAAAVCLVLIVSFSDKLPWKEPPREVAAFHSQPTLHVQPHDRAVGFVDSTMASQAAPGSGTRSLDAHGWAASCVPAVSLTNVILLVDGKPAGETKSFYPRPDVAAAYGRPDFELSGWKLSSTVGPLSSGDHTVTLRAVLANGESIDLPGPKLTIP